MTHQLFSTVIALLFLVVILMFASHTYAIKCYICGEGSESPFYDTKSTSINQSFVKERIQTSCDGFDLSLTPQEREKYAIECPIDYKSCSVVVEANVVRSCFKHTVKDCKNFNSNRYCYCDYDLCNKEDVGAFIEQRGRIKVENEDDEGGDDDDMETEESGDHEDYEEITSRESHQHESTTINKIINKVNEINQAATLTSTTVAPIQPAMNKAVNFNLTVHFVILLSLIIILVATGYNNYNLS